MKRNRIQNIVCTVFVLIMESLAQAEYAKEDGPILNSKNRYLDTNPNTTMQLECTGGQPITWGFGYPVSMLESKEYQELTAVNATVMPDGIYRSWITLNFTSYLDTGRYACYYNSTPEDADWVYIYVNDPERLLLPPKKTFINVKPSEPARLPCFATHSATNVTLWKMPATAVNIADDLKYSHAEGFTVIFPTNFYEGIFVCKANLGDRKEQLMMMLHFLPESTSVPRIFMDVTEAEYVLVNSSFSLTCTVKVDAGMLFDVKWDYPLHAKGVNITSFYTSPNERREKLTVLKAEKSHEGWYRCSAEDHSKKKDFKEAHIYVHEKAKPAFVTFMAEENMMLPLILNRGEDLTLKANFTVYPPNDIFNLHWKRNGKHITGRIGKYQMKQTTSQASLSILNVTGLDTGIYTLLGEASGGMTNLSFRVLIKDVPVVDLLLDRQRFYQAQNNYSISCVVTGFPKPDIKWMWKAYCIQGLLCNDTLPWKDVEKHPTGNGDEVFHGTSSEVTESITSTLSVIANVSVLYRCEAVNEVGANQSIVPFIITDVSQGFGIILETKQPVEGESLSIMCAANRIVFSKIEWMWEPGPGNATLVLIGDEVVSSTSQYSSQLTVNFDAIFTNESGLYRCFAFYRNDSTKYETDAVNITVAERTEEQSSQKKHDHKNTMHASIAIGGTSVLILLILVVKWLCGRKGRHRRVFPDDETFRDGQMNMFNPEIPLDEQADLLPYHDVWEFPKEKLKLGRTLGQGAFGRVVKAEAFGLNDYEESTTVAVKMLKEKFDMTQQKALMAELKILIHLGHHVNIVNLLGAVTKDLHMGELYVIVEYCRYGNLRHYLLRHRDKYVDETHQTSCEPMNLPDAGHRDTIDSPTSSACLLKSANSSSSASVFAVDNLTYRQRTRSTSAKCKFATFGKISGEETNEAFSCSSGTTSGSMFSGNFSQSDSTEEAEVISTSHLLCFSFQCAKGMEYLAQRKLIHRDLAARNVLLAAGKVVKICDFGLAKDCYKYSNYVKKNHGPLPIKWMAIESIGDQVFTTKSDVWSFGVLLWEFFTLGGNPYPGIEVDEEFYRRLKTGYRMSKPERCPDAVYDIMTQCWEADPSRRPNFSELCVELGNFIEASVRQHYEDLNEPYLEMNRRLPYHEYLNDCIGAKTPGYVNVTEFAEDLTNYDNVPPARPVSNQPVTKEPMVHAGLSSSDTTTTALAQADEKYVPDYLCMDNCSPPPTPAFTEETTHFIFPDV